MNEYTIHLESPRLQLQGSDFDAAQAYLDEAEPDAGAAAIYDYEQGILSATMQVKARAAGAAVDRAIELFYGALEAAGFNVNLPGWRLKLEVEPTTDSEAA